MKQSAFLFSLITLLTLSLSAQEEDKSIFRPALILGFNATQVAGDDLAGYRKLGANAGAGAFIMLPKNFSVNFEILYSQKGSRTTNNEIFQNIESYKLILDYIDVPLVVNYHDKQRAIFGLGVVYSNLVRYKELRGDVEWEDPEGSPYRTAGLEALVNVTFLFAKKFGINLRYTYSLIDITNREISYSNLKNKGQKNNVLSLRLMYMF